MESKTKQTNTTEINNEVVDTTPNNVSTIGTETVNDSSLTSPTQKAPSVTRTASENGVAIQDSMLDSNTLDAVEKLADHIAKSPLFGSAFEINRTTADGSIITEVDRHAIFTCMAIGIEVGLKPMQALALGRTLNREAVIKITYGKSMGLDPFFAMKDIFIWASNGRELIYTGIHAVNACLLQIGVITKIVKDGRITPILIDATTNEPISSFNPNIHFYIKGLKADAVKKKLDAGLTPVKTEIPTPDKVEATITLIRKGIEITRSYSLQEAIDAHLYGGITSFGEEVKGKDNWNKYPSAHLIKMATMLAARIIAADKLGGVYIADEISTIKQSNNSNYQDTEYVEVD